MKKTNLKSSLNLSLMMMGIFLVIANTVPAQAGQVVGQVTAVDSLRNTIDIDGIKHKLSASAISKANMRDAATLLRSFKPGQAVFYEADKNELKKIEAVEGVVDFPSGLGPLPRVPGGNLPSRP